MKVLFVDDEPRVLEAIQRMLSEAADHWDVDTATSGQEALVKLAKGKFDVLVTDMRMPGMDGAQLLAEVNERWPSITRIVLSGQTDQEQAMKTLTTAHQFLSKPCNPRTLTRVVEEAHKLGALTPNARVRALASAVHRLPNVPRVHDRILLLLERQDASAREAADLVAQDPALCARVLRIVNSAFFARGQIVRDVRSATVRLGLDMLRVLLISERAGMGLPGARIEKIQENALDAGGLAARIVPLHEQRAAFTAALLCDVGALVLEQGAPDESAAVREFASEFKVATHVAEKELLGSSHAEIGGYVLGLWGMPPSIVDAVVKHHELGTEPTALTAGVHVAHRIVSGEDVSAFAAEAAGVELIVDRLRESFIAGKNKGRS
jgi:HD-like signal output (HDOD) protein